MHLPFPIVPAYSCTITSFPWDNLAAFHFVESLVNFSFCLIHPVDADGRYRSTVVPGFWFEVAWVLSEEPPNVLQALSQIVGPEKVLAQGTQPGQSAGAGEG